MGYFFSGGMFTSYSIEKRVVDQPIANQNFGNALIIR